MDARNPAAFAHHACRLHPFLNNGPTLPRALGQRQGDVGRIALTVERQVHATNNTIDIQMFVLGLHLLR